ncbi:hypothetical protein EJ08DRAFT_354585 [Tothia fuscella]|uniref:Uncharacterized protein n=1 Tax=Tothia fuscella TaxID=1048955 RepID=A0A9P4NM08_9PEZI|nr:hypothetical protein EJ08DRAFT_354585 [Tothia fuscella]
MGFRALFSVQLLVAITGMLFSPPPSPHKTTSDPEKSLPFGGMFKSKSSRASSSHHSGIDDVPEREWEMVRIPDTPGTTGGMKSPPSSTTNVDGQEERQLGGERQLNPMTPRTTAFHALDGGQGKHAEPLPAWGLRREEKMPWSQRV